MALSWLRNREVLGSCRARTGDYNRIYSSMFSSIGPQPGKPYDHGGIFNLEFSQDGSILIAACERKSVVLFETTNRHQIKVLDNVHDDCVNCVKFLDDRLFASCSDDSTVALYDTRNLKTKIRTLRGHSNWVKNIEYSKKDCLLVTSGFDGSIFTWDLNSYTENNHTYQKVFHTPGLMRCRLSPDDTKLVICTTGGYLIIIHDLDLSTLSRDLAGFRPNLYRLMQVRRQYLPIASKYDYLFSKNQKSNRVELVSDFPKGNDAEVISSLQIHPQGWVALSRNNSYDESSEWTCVHDIQEIDSDDDEPPIPEILQENMFGSNQPTDGSETFSEVVASNNSDTSNETSSTSDQSNFNRPANPNIQIDPPSDGDNDNEGQGGNGENEDEIHIIPFQNQHASMLRPSLINTEEILDLWTGNIAYFQRTRRTLTERPNRIHTGIITNTMRNVRRPNIKQNRRRMLYFSAEPNKGKGFIKELCFSNDGRLICSPHARGIRLLSFSKDCQELPYALPSNGIPQRLNEVLVSSENHSDIVVSTKFSPRGPICVSGCLRGELTWYQPI